MIEIIQWFLIVSVQSNDNSILMQRLSKIDMIITETPFDVLSVSVRESKEEDHHPHPQLLTRSPEETIIPALTHILYYTPKSTAFCLNLSASSPRQ